MCCKRGVWPVFLPGQAASLTTEVRLTPTLSCDSRYDQEAMYFHPAVREAKRVELAEGLADALAGPFHAQMRHLLDRELVSWWGVRECAQVHTSH